MSDFDNDGFDDLVLGVRGESIGAIARAGAANVLRGSAAGLTAVGNQLWHQNVAGLGGAEADDRFAGALASGDFNNDGFDDLALGVRGEDIGTVANAGAVNVLRGSGAGLTATGGQIWHQNSAGILDLAESGDAFGSALAVGDFNNDGFDDLAIGVHDEAVGTVANAGAVNVLRGSAAGLTAAGNQIWHQDSAGIANVAEASDFFSDALAVGDFNNDGFDDLAIGARGEDIGAVANAGAVNVLRGSAAGLTATGNQIWHQDSAGIASAAESGDSFGDALAVGDFNNDGFDDLAVGVRGEDIGAVANGGAVSVLRGSAAGLTATGNQIWTQDSPNVANTVEAGDGFGAALASGDFNNDGFDDLAIGAPREDIVGGGRDAGAVNVLYGSAAGLTATGAHIWHQDIAGIESAAETGDFFGEFLSIGDFNNDGFDDMAIGAPGEDIGSAVDAGATTVLLGSAAGLTAAGEQIWHQDSAGILDVAEAGDLFGGWLV